MKEVLYEVRCLKSYLQLILLTLLGEISTHTEGPILFNPCLVMDIPSSLLRIQLPESR